MNRYSYAKQRPTSLYDNYGLFEVGDFPPDPDSNTIYCNNGSSDVLFGDLYSGKKGDCLNGGIRLHENIHKSRFDRSSSGGCGRHRGIKAIYYSNESECDNEERIALKDQREHYKKKLEQEDCDKGCNNYLKSEIVYISKILAQSVVPICKCDYFWFEGGELKCMVIRIGS